MSHILTVDNLCGQTFELPIASSAGAEGMKRLTMRVSPHTADTHVLYVVTARGPLDGDKDEELVHTVDTTIAVSVYNDALDD